MQKPKQLLSDLPPPEEVGYSWADQAAWRAQWNARIAALDPEDQKKFLELDRARCAQDPKYWIDRWCWMQNPDGAAPPHERSVPVILWPRQRELVDFMVKCIREPHDGAVPKTRKLGVTWLFLLVCQWFATFERDFSALLISRKAELVDKLGSMKALLEKVRWSHQRQPSHLRPRMTSTYMHLYFPDTGSSINGETTNKGAGQGDRHSVVGIDEAARIDPTTAQHLRISTESVGPRFWIWNPGPTAHPTYRMHLGDEGVRLPDTWVMELGWRTDPRRTDEWWDGRLVANGGSMTEEERESVYGGRYGYVTGGTIFVMPPRRKWILSPDSDQYAELHAKSIYAPLVGGLDFGFGGSIMACMLALWHRESDTICIVWDQTWSRTRVDIISADINATIKGHPGSGTIYPDPAHNHDSTAMMVGDRTIMVNHGVPLGMLPTGSIGREEIEAAFKYIQIRINDGRYFVLETCEYAIQVLTQWRRKLPEGVEVGQVAQAYVPPRHDDLSHGGTSLVYMEHGMRQDVPDREIRDRSNSVPMPAQAPW